MHICELCRALLPNSANFCGQCGYALGASTILPTASNLLIANSEYSSNQIATVDNNIATGLSDARHELQMSPSLHNHDANELPIASNDETLCPLAPLPSHKYPSSSDMEDQNHLNGPHPLPGFGHDIYQQLAQDVADLLDNMNQQPNSE